MVIFFDEFVVVVVVTIKGVIVVVVVASVVMVVCISVTLLEVIKLVHFSIKWRNLSQTGKIGSGKNQKYFFFLLGLKYSLRTCFESKNFSSNSCPELSNQQLSFSACQVY